MINFHVSFVPDHIPGTNRVSISAVFALCAVLAVGGCAKRLSRPSAASLGTMQARYTTEPVNIDGVLDDQAWKTAPAYRMSLGEDRMAKGQRLAERGEVRLVWDDRNFYVGIRFRDRDIVAEADVDQISHYERGDLVEVFLKPRNQTWYWELYATPRSQKTSLWFPKTGTLTIRRCGLRVAARCQGTLNESHDKDRSWTAEVAMPLRDLVTADQSFGPGTQWSILVSRYNHRRGLKDPELSMVPQLSKTNYHLIEEYAVLELTRAGPE